MGLSPRPLPAIAETLCQRLGAPSRLVAHLMLVHDVACKLVSELRYQIPLLCIDQEAVRLGAATHDLGKVLHPEELNGPGTRHEVDGPGLLTEHVLASEIARFARTHARWQDGPVEIEGLMVALADKVWKGNRVDALEREIVRRISAQTEMDQWEVFSRLDIVLEELATPADERLNWQSNQ